MKEKGLFWDIDHYTILVNFLLLNLYRLLYFSKQTISSKKVFYISLDVYSIWCILTSCNQAVVGQVMTCWKGVPQVAYNHHFQVAYHLKDFLQIYYSYNNENLTVGKLASITTVQKSLAAFVCWFLRRWQTKFFDISTGYIKFWDEIYSENCQLFKPFQRFQFTFMYHEKSIFMRVNQLSSTHFSS